MSISKNQYYSVSRAKLPLSRRSWALLQTESVVSLAGGDARRHTRTGSCRRAACVHVRGGRRHACARHRICLRGVHGPRARLHCPWMDADATRAVCKVLHASMARRARLENEGGRVRAVVPLVRGPECGKTQKRSRHARLDQSGAVVRLCSVLWMY